VRNLANVDIAFDDAFWLFVQRVMEWRFSTSSNELSLVANAARSYNCALVASRHSSQPHTRCVQSR